MSINKKKLETLKGNYGEDYLQWKSWNNKNQFGHLKKNQEHYFDAEISRIKSKILINSKVLEIGFGNGSFLKYAKQNGWDIYGTEANEILVKIANENGFKAKLAEDISSFDDYSFDLIVAFDVLEHIPQNLLPKFLLTVKRKLKSNGFFIARFPNADSPFGLKNQNGDITHLTNIGSGKIEYFASLTKMHIVFIGGEAEPIFGGGILKFIHRIISVPVKKIINLIINLIFFPRSNLSFCSLNMVTILKSIE